MSDAAALADRAASLLREMGLEAEIYLEDSVSSSIAVSSGKTVSFEMSEELGAGIRIFDRGRVGFAHTSDLSADGVRRAAGAAKALAGHTDADPGNRLPAREIDSAPDEESSDLSVAGMETYRKVALARAMEEAARGVDPRITRVPEAKYEDLVGRVEIRDTEGLSRGCEFARVYGSIEVVAEEHRLSQSGVGCDFAVRFSALDPFRIGREAAGRALGKLGAGRAATGTADIVFDPWAWAELLEAFSPVLTGERVVKGRSFLAGNVGRRVASETVTLIDDGRLAGADGSYPFDGEGVPTRRNTLVERGVLRGFLHNGWSAARMGTAPTGNGSRSSYMELPGAAPTTLFLQPSTRTPEEILNMVEGGFRITELMGLHTLDPVTGEFSLGAGGQRIRSGRAEGPVAGIGLAGSIQGLFGGITAVGADLRLFPGNVAGSTILARGLSISGS